MAQIDAFRGSNALPTYPPRKAQAVVFTDGLFVPNEVTRRLVVGVGGDVAAIMADDVDPVTLKLPAGVHELQIKAIVEAGTAATSLVALFG